ncbi:S-layer homology domain-containing protein [Heliophilum fasciatum]|uniref:S-layer family protein n=1 Tax=Heliophilum fasciatum TaxID=35700 RepID=A0A4R2RW45_9FIRM|nr:S-layer homology domain-containing protein [Heliophilum fasciatum]MCW2276877.1 hypothetical protein [Heliophilum fasciatum]TCP68662.1 S-layer family protein [Heliophilum fasciatum]
MRKKIIQCILTGLLALGLGTAAEAGDISIRVTDPAAEVSSWRPINVQYEGTMTSENIPTSMPQVGFGENQMMGFIYFKADGRQAPPVEAPTTEAPTTQAPAREASMTEGSATAALTREEPTAEASMAATPTEPKAPRPATVHQGSRVTLTLPYGVAYMKTPTAETLDQYVDIPSMVNWEVNAIVDSPNAPALKFIEATPHSLTVEIVNYRFDAVPMLEFLFNRPNYSAVRISDMVMWPQSPADLQGTISRQEFFQQSLSVTSSLRPVPNVSEAAATTILQRFTDGDRTHPALKPGVAGLVQEGLVIGRPGNILAPADALTRAEAVTELSRFFAWNGQKAPTAFGDTADSWAKDILNSAHAHGLALGYPDRTFRPEARITREEAYDLLRRIFEMPSM